MNFNKRIETSAVSYRRNDHMFRLAAKYRGIINILFNSFKISSKNNLIFY